MTQLDLLPPAEGHDPHCRALTPLAPGVRGSAVFGGPKDCYRYRLERWIDMPDARTVMYLWLNPSGAGVTVNDNTVAKGWRLALRWGFRRMLVGNVHAYRCTDQMRLLEVDDPFGPDNMRHIIEMGREAEMIVVGYGTPKIVKLRGRGPDVARQMVAAGLKLNVLRLSKYGVPEHPLFLPETLTPQPWEPPAA